MREVPLTQVKDKLSEYLRLAEEENIIIRGTANRQGSWSVLRQKTTGLTIGWNTMSDF
jgi:hypothetical protein